MLERATELAGILGKAFLTPLGLPLGRIEPGRRVLIGSELVLIPTYSPHKLFGIGTISLAEVGSMSLELTRLSQATGDRQWFDLVRTPPSTCVPGAYPQAQRATDFLDSNVTPRSTITPLIPTMFNPNGNDVMVGTYSFGGMGTSSCPPRIMLMDS